MRCLILIFGVGAVTSLSACGTFKSLPDNFVYDTSLRGEQGLLGRAERVKSADTLLQAGSVTDPAAALKSAFPDKEVKVRQWGLRFFNSDWTRYQVVFDADVDAGKTRTKCREVSTEGPVGAPTLKALRAENGRGFKDELQALFQACIEKVKAG